MVIENSISTEDLAPVVQLAVMIDDKLFAGLDLTPLVQDEARLLTESVDRARSAASLSAMADQHLQMVMLHHRMPSSASGMPSTARPIAVARVPTLPSAS